jgi:hypothetical protein
VPKSQVIFKKQPTKFWQVVLFENRKHSASFQIFYTFLVENLHRNCPDFLHISGTKIT